MRAVGYAGTVPEAPAYVRAHAHYVTATPGGSGAFRDFVEHLLAQRGLLEDTVGRYLDETAPDGPA
jgi:3-deoxy-D-manno-octulosonate 8-phosphate phosphatase KdsC-like HAD superfamily phosphatase